METGSGLFTLLSSRKNQWLGIDAHKKIQVAKICRYLHFTRPNDDNISHSCEANGGLE